MTVVGLGKWGSFVRGARKRAESKNKVVASLLGVGWQCRLGCLRSVVPRGSSCRRVAYMGRHVDTAGVRRRCRAGLRVVGGCDLLLLLVLRYGTRMAVVLHIGRPLRRPLRILLRAVHQERAGDTARHATADQDPPPHPGWTRLAVPLCDDCPVRIIAVAVTVLVLQAGG